MSQAEMVRTQAEVALRASLFGAFAVATADGATIAISNRRARALLAMLVLAPGQPLEREYISKLLWPGRFAPQARASLRQCLLDLDRLLTPLVGDVLTISHGRIAIDPARVHSDLSDLEAALVDARVDEACDLLSAIGNQPLFDQIDLGAPFQAWLAVQRQHVESRLHSAIDRASANLDAAGRSRLGNAWSAAGRSPLLQRQQKARIAVLPFELHDAIGGPFFLAEGVVEELAFRLGGVPALAVAGRTSVMALAGHGRTLPELASALNASHLVEGDVHRSSTGVRVDLRLIDGRSGLQLWSDRYEGTVADALASRHVIGGHFLHGLCAALDVEAPPAPARRMTRDREAYALYLQGRELTWRAVGDGVVAKGVELLEQALAIDGDFAECWAALAEAHLYVAGFTTAPDRRERALAMADCARRAIALDPRQGHARAMLAMHEFTRHRPLAALDLGFEAYRLAPNDPAVTLRLGILLLYLGRARAALPYIEAAVASDPVHGRNYAALCAVHLCLGDFDHAIAAGRRMADLGFPAPWLAVAYAANGEHARGVEVYCGLRTLLGTTIARPPGMPPIDDAARDAYFAFAAKGICSGDADARAAYCTMIDTLHQTMPDPYDNSIAYPAIWMGHAELVMKIYAEQTSLANIFGLMALWVDVDPIRRTWRHPDFMGFAERMGFVAAWEKHGWPDVMPSGHGTN